MIAGSFALVQRGSARRTATVAQAGRLAAQSREVAAKHPDLGLLLALEAGRLDDSVDSRGALLGALEHGSRIRAWLQGFDSPVVATAFSPDGTLLRRDDDRGDHALRHGDLEARRPAAAIVAGRLGGRRLQPRRADAGDRGRKGPRRAVGRRDQEGASGADGSGGGDLGSARALRRSLQPGRQRHRRRPAGDEPRHAVGDRDRSGDRPADHHEPAGDGRRAIDLLQPGFEADRRPGRSRDRGDLGGRHGAPGRRAARDRERGRGGRRSSPTAAGC